ncbi:MAG: hypothetical protein HY717_13815, partial [Planctomycetes bacterium]|nr:hypothetical protein [Planctomycetota bacterium]
FTTGLLILILPSPLSSGTEAYFEDHFDSPDQNPNLESYSPYFKVSNGTIFRESNQTFDDRRYLRTVLADYNQRDFAYEINFTNKEDIIFIGLGSGLREAAYNVPVTSVYLSIHPVTIDTGVFLYTKYGDVPLGRLFSSGPHRALIEKHGSSITFSVDEKFNGTFNPDISVTLPDLQDVAPFLTDTTSHLFFGAVIPLEKFDDLKIYSPPQAFSDCNNNRTDDAAEIAAGTLPDEDTNGIPDECQLQKVYFEDHFESSFPNPSLEGYKSYFSVAKGVIRRTGYLAFDDRQYMRTVASDYNMRDFIFEITFTTKNDIVFIGIGFGERRENGYHEPALSMNFRAHPLVNEGFVEVTTATGGVKVGNLKTAGPHRARIEKIGSKITFSIDDSYNGNFKADMSVAFPVLENVGPFLNDRNSHLFFGCVIPDEIFDDLLIRDPGLPETDCNHNGINDSIDISSGSSKDQNGDAIPDDCQLFQGALAILPDRMGCVKIALNHQIAIKGGEIGLAFGPSFLIPQRIQAGADLPDSAEIHFNFKPSVNCTSSSGVTAGITIGWINSPAGDVVIPPGAHELFEICFTPALDASAGGNFPLKFVRCLGVAEAPVRNILTGQNGESVLVTTQDGEVRLLALPQFRRGDANDDGLFDISDAISSLSCMFLGELCLDCMDVMDVNDDGHIDTTDPINLLYWRFLTGLPPKDPFPGCGPDPTNDNLLECQTPLSCSKTGH